MTPAEQSKLAAQAGLETKDCFPPDTPWRRRFVELLYEQHLLADKWRGINCQNRGDGSAVQMIQAEKLEACAKEIQALREALSYYAESSNWRRDVHTVGLRKAWKKPAVASDRGGLARLVLMQKEGKK